MLLYCISNSQCINLYTLYLQCNDESLQQKINERSMCLFSIEQSKCTACESTMHLTSRIFNNSTK